MDFRLSAEEARFQHEVHDWLVANLPAGWGTPAYRMAEGPEEKVRFARWWQRRLYAGGWAGLSWPKEYGGRGATFLEQLVFGQELGRLNLPLGCNTLGVIMTGPALMQWGTEEQKQRYLRPILSGDEIWCEGMSEPG